MPDPVAVNLVEILEPSGVVLGHVLETSELSGNRIVHDVAETPHGFFVRLGEIPADILRPQGHILAGGVHERVGDVGARQLGQDAGLAVVHHVLSGRRPIVEDVCVSDAAFTLRDERRGHGETNLGLRLHDNGMDIGIVWIFERRDPDASPGRPHLVHVVGELGLIDILHFLDRVARFDLGKHEPVAVVVVPHVLVIEVGVAPVILSSLGLVPVIEDQHLSVRILRRHEEKHEIVQDFVDLS